MPNELMYIGRTTVASGMARPVDVFVGGDALYHVEIVDNGRETWNSEQARAMGKLLIEAADEADKLRAEWLKEHPQAGAGG